MLESQGLWILGQNSGFPDSSVGKESTCKAGDPSLSPGSGSSPGEGIGYTLQYFGGFPGGSHGKEFPCNVEDLGSIPGLGRSPGGGHGNPLRYSCLENPDERGAWRADLLSMRISRFIHVATNCIISFFSYG